MLEKKLVFSVQETAKFLGISRNTAYCLIRNGDLPAVWLGKRRVVVPVVALEQFLLTGIVNKKDK